MVAHRCKSKIWKIETRGSGVQFIICYIGNSGVNKAYKRPCLKK